MSARALTALVALRFVLVGDTTARAAADPPAAAVAVGEPVGGTTADDPPDGSPSDGRRRFAEQVEVVAEGTAGTDAPAELPVRPAEVMAVAGAADNVFRALQTLPGVAGTAEFDSRLSVRGGSPDENLTIMDGVEIHDPYRLFGLTSAFNPETVRSFDLYAGAFSVKYGDRLSSLLVVENRPGTEEGRLRGATALSLTDANVVLEGRLPRGSRGSWLVTARRTYYDLVANRIVGTDLPAFGDVQARADWRIGAAGHLTFVGLASRESADARFEGDRPGEQGLFVTGTRNDLASVNFRTLIGGKVISRTIASFYRNRQDLAADAQFRAEARRSNAPDDAVGFRVADVQFDRLLGVSDLSLRQEVLVSAGRHLVETGLEAHGLRTQTRWQIAGDRNPAVANGSSVQGGAGLPGSLDSAVDSARLGAWVQDRWDPASALSLEGGLRLDWSGVNRRATLSPRLTATFRLGPATRVRAGGGLFSQSPGYEKLVQSDYFVDLTGGLGRSLRYERATQAVLGLERDLGAGVTARVEGYWKGFRDLVVGRLETEEERAARVERYDFPPELRSSVPAEAQITSIPVNGASGDAAGIEVFLQKRAAPGARLSGWASYAYARARRREYGLTLPFDYDRPHAATLVGAWRLGPRWDVAATLRAYSGFPRTPVLGLRVAADEAPDGRFVPALDADGRYVYETGLGGVRNLNSARLPAFVRLDLRLSWRPRGATGRWMVYLDVINATSRRNAGQISASLEYDPASPLDQPRLVEQRTAAVPFLPSFGVRFRF
jgi:vitamin B12 transporter